MGAMENKSLNIFNSKLVLASPETATDADYAAILGVIGHEYFHNWTGNRVTCRDWFQLSLKEGLTVFRDQEFSSDMGSRTVKRIADVSRLRNYQFPQQSEEHKRKARSERFGLAQSVTTDEEAKKKSRLSRFGAVPAVPKANAQEEDKKKARAVRYMFAVGSKRIYTRQKSKLQRKNISVGEELGYLNEMAA